MPPGESGTLTVDVLAIAAAAAWLVVFGWCSVLTSRPALRAGTADPGPSLSPVRPALVNLSVTRCRLNGAAYPATILDLAAGGYLTISERAPGQLWCGVPASSPPGTGLAGSERLVLAGARVMASGGGAPFEALAESCASDVLEAVQPSSCSWLGAGHRRGAAADGIRLRAGLPPQQAWLGGGWEPDPLVLDDQAIVINVRDKGLIVLTGCGHAGIVNICRYARRLTGDQPLYAAMGGFHLNGPLFER